MSLKRSAKRRKVLLDKLYEKQAGKCHWCRGKLSKEARKNNSTKSDTATFEHKLPRQAGGSESEKNLVLACYKCNATRGNKLSAPQLRTKTPTVRRVNPEGEGLIDLYFPVLDYGFIALKDYMGTDECIEDAARTSYGIGTKKRTDTGGLIRYLLRHEHMSPFEMAEVKLHVGMPIFVARQWVRHRMASLNEYSGRYSVMPTMFYKPDKFSLQSKVNKQGRSVDGLELVDEEQAQTWLCNNRRDTEDLYNHLISMGVSREQARIDLPLSTYTFWYWKCDIRNLLHYIGLRSDPHAQKEIRVYSDIMAGMLQKMFPHTFNAFLDYRFLSTNFTIEELDLMRKIVSAEYTEKQIDHLLEKSGLSKGERGEFKAKLHDKQRPNFDLDLTAAKTPEYFERLIQEHSLET